MKVLLIEGDRTVADGVRRALTDAASSIYDTDDGNEAVELAGIYDYDLIVLGETLADGSPVRVLRRLRAERVAVPAMVLSVDDTPARIAEMLDGGADDYVVRPVNREVLVARAKAVVRRAQGRPSNEIVVGPIVISETGVAVSGRPVRLTDQEQRLLRILGERKNLPVNKDVVTSALYRTEADEPDTKIVDVLVCRIRRKLREAGASGHIATHWGKGYSLRENAGKDPVQSQFDTSSGSMRILQVLSDGLVRRGAEIAREAKLDRTQISGFLGRLQERGCIIPEIRRAGRRRISHWTITKTGRAELAQRLKTEQRIKEAA